MEKYGRTTILANITEKELLGKKNKALDDTIINILEESAAIHEGNRAETLNLKSYYYGDQDIYDKVKHTRDEINNKIVENWAYAFVDFKKTYLLGEPIQYVQQGDINTEEISLLNRLLSYEGKKTKDLELYEDILVCGRGFRYVNKDADVNLEEDEAPFEIINCPVDRTEVVYSSTLGNEQLLAYIETDMEYYPEPSANDEGVPIEPIPYRIYTVYLRNQVITYSNKDGKWKRIGKPTPLLYNTHIITEHYVNRKRISLIELGKDLFDAVNNLESLDADDFEQFVNAIMVFTNAKISEEELEEVKELGALCINSTDGQKASVDLLEQRLNSNDTQTYYNRLLDALHTILGVPKATDNGYMTSGDTGKAKLTGQGYTSATIRIKNDINMFGMCDMKCIKLIIKICKEMTNLGIKNLKVSNIQPNFQTDTSDNLLVKTQGLMNLYACDIPREYANSLVNLFPDAHQVTEEQNRLFGEQVSQQGAKKDTENEINEQNNTITRVSQSDSQGQ